MMKQRLQKIYQRTNMDVVGGVGGIFFLVMSYLLAPPSLQQAGLIGTVNKDIDQASMQSVEAGEKSVVATHSGTVRRADDHKTFNIKNNPGDLIASATGRQIPIPAKQRFVRIAGHSGSGLKGAGSSRGTQIASLISSPSITSGIVAKTANKADVIVGFRRGGGAGRHSGGQFSNDVKEADSDKTWQDEEKTVAVYHDDSLIDTSSVEATGQDGQVAEDLAVQQREKFLLMRIARLSRDIESGSFDRWLDSVAARNPEKARHVMDPRVLLQQYQQELDKLQEHFS